MADLVDTLGPGDAVLHRVRWPRAGADRMRARRALEGAAVAVAWQPRQLPAAAWIVIRQLGHRPPRGDRRAWSEAAQRGIDAAAAAARRPWSEPDAANAPAVWFFDRHELLACLVRDQAQRCVAERWWWRSLLGDRTPQQLLRAQVLEHGETMVAVFARLAVQPSSAGHACADLERWLAQLSDAEVAQAEAEIQRRYALPALAGPQAGLPWMPQRETARTDTASPEGAAARCEAGPSQGVDTCDVPGPALRQVVHQFKGRVPEWDRSPLPARPRRLLALALLLARAPALARSEALASAWPLLAAPPDDPPDAAAEPAARSGPDPPSSLPRSFRPEVRGLRSTSRHEHPLGDRARPRVRPALVDADDPRPTRPQAAARPGIVTPRAGPPAAVISAPHAPVGSADSLEIQTAYGGLFYLLNAALALGLWGDFTMPRAAGLALSPWDWLARLGRAWFGRAFAADPLWTLLADLAGRPPRRRPGSGFVPAPGWRFDSRWQAAGKAGDETPFVGSSELWWREMRRRLRSRLAQALGCRNAEAPGLLCLAPARVVLAATELHVRLSLSDLPLPVRVAGLDRDPGWIPAAGRSIAFHFD